MNKQNALIIFVKNARLGKVKTRLAATVGEQKALDIYKQLLAHTKQVVRPLNCVKTVWYSLEVEEDAGWNAPEVQKKVQLGEDLGQRMLHAFRYTLNQPEVKHAVIIGSDCAELETTHIETAFNALEKHELVIGPARDGGYYLLGVNRLYPELFRDIVWSTEQVFDSTIEKARQLGLSIHTLATLSDVDTFADWEKVEQKLRVYD